MLVKRLTSPTFSLQHSGRDYTFVISLNILCSSPEKTELFLPEVYKAMLTPQSNWQEDHLQHGFECLSVASVCTHDSEDINYYP